MAEKNIKSRVVLKHDTEANWNLATNFIPLRGEMIIYDADSTYTYPRIKIGDGTTNVNSLPFIDDIKVSISDTISNDEIDTICGTTIQSAEDVKL